MPLNRSGTVKHLMKYIFLFFFSPFLIFARAGFSEIFFETPGGHIICHCDPYSSSQTPILIGFEKLEKLDKWYFYRNHVIGFGNNYYFIFNESTLSIQYFKDVKQWHNAIIKQRLKPIIYTRWLNLSDSPEEFKFAIVVIAILAFPFALIVVIILSFLHYRRIIIWGKNSFRILWLCFLLFVLYYISNVHLVCY